jgi:adenine phosphoribosyltransferase
VEELKNVIRDIPDYPKPGIVFKDITTLLKDRSAFKAMGDRFVEEFSGHDIDVVAGIEARGFLFAPLLAYHLNAGVVPLRKPNKLPGETVRVDYELEYGTDSLEVHHDAIERGERVLIIDDLLATGGSANAACQLVEEIGGDIVSLAFLVELSFLDGRSRLEKYDVFSMLQYDGE